MKHCKHPHVDVAGVMNTIKNAKSLAVLFLGRIVWEDKNFWLFIVLLCLFSSCNEYNGRSINVTISGHVILVLELLHFYGPIRVIWKG